MPADQPTDSKVASPAKLTPAVAVASGSCCDVLLAVESFPQTRCMQGHIAGPAVQDTALAADAAAEKVAHAGAAEATIIAAAAAEALAIAAVAVAAAEDVASIAAGSVTSAAPAEALPPGVR